MNINFGRNTFLYEDGGSYFIRDENGKIGKIPKNKFYHGQIVKTRSEYFSPKSFTRLIDPAWVSERNEWVYGENYITMQGESGGCGYSFPESDFLELTDSDSILYANRIYLKNELAELEVRRKEISGKLSMIEYALSISVKEWDKVRKKCISCNASMVVNKSNCNIDKCDTCYNETNK